MYPLFFASNREKIFSFLEARYFYLFLQFLLTIPTYSDLDILEFYLKQYNIVFAFHLKSRPLKSTWEDPTLKCQKQFSLLSPIRHISFSGPWIKFPAIYNTVFTAKRTSIFIFTIKFRTIIGRISPKTKTGIDDNSFLGSTLCLPITKVFIHFSSFIYTPSYVSFVSRSRPNCFAISFSSPIITLSLSSLLSMIFFSLLISS